MLARRGRSVFGAAAIALGATLASACYSQSEDVIVDFDGCATPSRAIVAFGSSEADAHAKYLAGGSLEFARDPKTGVTFSPILPFTFTSDPLYVLVVAGVDSTDPLACANTLDDCIVFTAKLHKGADVLGGQNYTLGVALDDGCVGVECEEGTTCLATDSCNDTNVCTTTSQCVSNDITCEILGGEVGQCDLPSTIGP